MKKTGPIVKLCHSECVCGSDFAVPKFMNGYKQPLPMRSDGHIGAKIRCKPAKTPSKNSTARVRNHLKVTGVLIMQRGIVHVLLVVSL